MLNPNLKDELIIQMNGRLANSLVFSEFNDRIRCEIVFKLENITFSVNDVIFEEEEDSYSIFFITKGNVILVHRETQTFIKDITVDEYFGEIGFFSK